MDNNRLTQQKVRNRGVEGQIGSKPGTQTQNANLRKSRDKENCAEFKQNWPIKINQNFKTKFSIEVLNLKIKRQGGTW
jgi:hypothetical protein